MHRAKTKLGSNKKLMALQEHKEIKTRHRPQICHKASPKMFITTHTNTHNQKLRIFSPVDVNAKKTKKTVDICEFNDNRRKQRKPNENNLKHDNVHSPCPVAQRLQLYRQAYYNEDQWRKIVRKLSSEIF